MTELDQLKQRVNASMESGVKTAQIRDDYEPAGQRMIQLLCETGKYVQRKVPSGLEYEWRLYAKDYAPY